MKQHDENDENCTCEFCKKIEQAREAYQTWVDLRQEAYDLARECGFQGEVEDKL